MRPSPARSGIPVEHEPYDMRRRTVLQTAARAFTERGFYKTSLDDIAAELNVTKAALYYYFKSKEEILYECQAAALRSITDPPLEEQGFTGLDKVERFVRRYTSMVVRDFGRCLVLVGTQPLEPESAAKCRKGRREVNDLLIRLIEEGIDDGSIVSCDPKLSAYFLFGTLNWIAQWYDERGAATLDEITDKLLGLLLVGLAPPGSQAARRAKSLRQPNHASVRKGRKSRSV